MLSKEKFKECVDMLITEYGDRGFTMTKEKAAQWYKYMNEMTEIEFMDRIDRCLIDCNHVPFMADIMRTNFEKNQNPWANIDS